jgi:hypothetical protein
MPLPNPNEVTPIVLHRAERRREQYVLVNGPTELPLTQFYCNTDNVDCGTSGRILDSEFKCWNHVDKKEGQ